MTDALELARLCINRGDAARALALLEKELAVRPADARIYGLAALALIQLERFPEAAATARRALAIQPEESSHWIALSLASASMGTAGDAAYAAERAIEVAPHDAEGYLAAASAAVLGETVTRETLEYTRAAALLEPHRVRTHVMHASVSMLVGDYAEAEASCREALRLDPVDEDALVMLRTIQFLRGRYGRSAAGSLSSLAATPQNESMSVMLRLASFARFAYLDGIVLVVAVIGSITHERIFLKLLGVTQLDASFRVLIAGIAVLAAAIVVVSYAVALRSQFPRFLRNLWWNGRAFRWWTLLMIVGFLMLIGAALVPAVFVSPLYRGSLPVLVIASLVLAGAMRNLVDDDA